ncbi:MAG: amino acid permease, partial [Methanobrevibacter sp.]|nr:amino acid permease [Methanobrevibacter sp.]
MAANHAGPAITISFIISAISCVLAGLSYAEFTSITPISGSAYSYSYMTIGEIFAWIIGWDLILEYLFCLSTVAVGWSGYFNQILQNIGIHLPAYLMNSPLMFSQAGGLELSGSLINLPAMFIIAVIGIIVAKGLKESNLFNTIIVITKLLIIFLFIGFGISYINPGNWIPYIPPNTGVFGQFGLSGILTGAGLVFFSYIGFDALSTFAQETKNPKKNIPIAIIASLAICTILYVIVSAILTGMVPYTQLDVTAPISIAIETMGANFTWLNIIVDIGAIFGITSVILVFCMGLTRILYSISKDGLLPKFLSKVGKKNKTPYNATIILAIFGMILAGILPLSFLNELTSIGTLLAFTLVSAAVIILRKTKPNLKRGFKVPLMPLVPILGIAICLAQMIALPVPTWERLIIWMILGL